ncbi:MAG: glutathione S-transferase family protein [Rhodocyclaceae bacterium]|nr:glutathione S-transferase family protein [Rhodocyclaceae bacterium]
MIRLIQFPPALGLPNASPFCLKLETWLRMAGLPYENHYTPNPRKGPKGKLPAIEDGGKLIGDSGLIVDYLARTYGIDLDAGLSPEAKAVALAWRRLFEEHLYWTVLYTRWIEEAGWQRTRDAFFGALPWPVKVLLPIMARRGMRAELHGQGIGRHRPEEIHKMGIADVDAVAAFLGDKPFFMGIEPTSLDAVAYGFLANVVRVDLDTPIRRRALEHVNLVAYCDRMEARYWQPR